MTKDPEYPIHTMYYEDMKEVDWQFNDILVVSVECLGKIIHD